MKKNGILLINLGTPDKAEETSVKRYLKEFLSDPRVIDLPFFLRWPLVNLLIVPFRFKKTTKAYQKIWTSLSPLLSNSLKIKESLEKKLPNDFIVELGMRYGHPSIESAFSKMKECEKIIIVPLFPQYSSAATGSALQKIMELISKKWNVSSLITIKDFYNDSGFISAYSQVIKQHLQHQNVDYVLFSYHGLPERHIDKSACQATCNRVNACPHVDLSSLYCYRAQCYASTHLIATECDLSRDQYAVSFQSRLGRTPWIKPYTDLMLPELIKKGIKHLAIVCPSFVADCLETLEEINIRAREQWLSLGGKEFTFIPCINDSPLFINAIANHVTTNFASL